MIPVGFADASESGRTGEESAQRAIARLEVERSGLRDAGVLYDAFGDPEFGRVMLDAVETRREIETPLGRLTARPTAAYSNLRDNAQEPLAVGQWRTEHSNSIVALGERLLLILFRRLDEGSHPELEIGLYLTEQASFSHIAPVAGAIEYAPRRGGSFTIGMLQGYVEHRKTAWEQAIDTFDAFIRAVSVVPPLEPPEDATSLRRRWLSLTQTAPPERAQRFLGTHLDTAALLGQRTAELHLALADAAENPALRPEPLLPFHQRALYQSVRNVLGRAFRTLHARLCDWPANLQELAAEVLELGGDRLTRLREMLAQDVRAVRIRCHGNFGLHDVLCQLDDVTIIDFEGDPDLPIGQRRAKASPLRDVAGMLWSYERAALHALHDYCVVTEIDSQERGRLDQWSDFWQAWTGATFLRAYLATAGDHPIVPRPGRALETLLELYFAERCASVLEHELQNRPLECALSLRKMHRFLAHEAARED